MKEEHTELIGNLEKFMDGLSIQLDASLYMFQKKGNKFMFLAVPQYSFTLKGIKEHILDRKSFNRTLIPLMVSEDLQDIHDMLDCLHELEAAIRKYKIEISI